RVVLTWGLTPPDLDLHLYGPLPDGKRFHVYHGNDSETNVTLDVDNRSGNGPETVTIKKVVPGRYECKVHAYSDPKDAKSKSAARALAGSSAEVRVYRHGEREPLSFRVDPTAEGSVWHVGYVEVMPDQSLKVVKYARNHYND